MRVIVGIDILPLPAVLLYSCVGGVNAEVQRATPFDTRYASIYPIY